MNANRTAEINTEPRALYFDFHGVWLVVRTNDDRCAEYIASDFSHFRSAPEQLPPGSVIRISVWLSLPPSNARPRRHAIRVKTKDADAYGIFGSSRLLRVQGGLFITQNFSSDHSELYCLDRDLLLDRAYLMIMSRLGEHLDLRGLHRIHAMGVAVGDRGVLCLMAMGGGKTTLCMSLMEFPEFSLLSDEAPLVDRHGKLHGFPIRIGVCEGDPLSAPKRFLKKASRVRHGPKILIDVAMYGDRLQQQATPNILFVGQRIPAPTTSIRRISRWRAVRALWENAVLARGLPQLLEFIHRISLQAISRQTMIHLSRMLACARLVIRCECYELELGVDREANSVAVREFLTNLLDDSPG